MLPGDFDDLLRLATNWAEEKEGLIISCGEALSDQGLLDAKLMGVASPEKIRLLKVKSIPIPTDSILKTAAHQTGLISPETVGLTLRYGIFIRDDCWMNRSLVAHECVHTSQYEKFGSIEAFLRQYLGECFNVGYPNAPLEQEAVLKSKQISKNNSDSRG